MRSLICITFYVPAMCHKHRHANSCAALSVSLKCLPVILHTAARPGSSSVAQNHQGKAVSRSRIRGPSDSVVVRQEGGKVRNLPRNAEGNISQVKWCIHLHNDWVEGAAENAKCQVWVSQGRGCLLPYLHSSLEGPGIDKEHQITAC